MMRKLVLGFCIIAIVAGEVNGMNKSQDYSVSYGGHPVKIEKTRWEHLAVKADEKRQINAELSLGLDALDNKEKMQSVIAMLAKLGAECSHYAWMVFVDTYPNNCDERQQRIGNIIATLAQFQVLNMPILLDLQNWYAEN